MLTLIKSNTININRNDEFFKSYFLNYYLINTIVFRDSNIKCSSCLNIVIYNPHVNIDDDQRRRKQYKIKLKRLAFVINYV